MSLLGEPMSDEARYLIYLIEQYAAGKGLTGEQVFALFDSNNLIPYIYQMYYTYHTERVENAIDDIDNRLSRLER
jgi:hypothetical protein